MREQEMRDRINQFLKVRMRGMLVPALGVSLLAVGCKKEGVTAVYSAPLPDGSYDTAAQVLADAPVVPVDASTPSVDTKPVMPDTTVLPRRDTAAPDSALPDAELPDASQVDADQPDSAIDVSRPDARPRDTGGGDLAKRDTASSDLGLVVKYSVPFRDAGAIGVLYMAQLPDGD